MGKAKFPNPFPRKALFILDYDGSVANPATDREYRQAPGATFDLKKHKAAILKTNQKLLEFMRHTAKAGNYDDVEIANGSIRQHLSTDRYNALRNRNGSCIPALVALYESLKTKLKSESDCGVHLKTTLMSDFWGQKNRGTNFQRSEKVIVENYFEYFDEEFPDEYFEHVYKLTPHTHPDESKLTLLYAQMHAAASKDRNTTIDCYFCDDDMTVLENLRDFFSEHPDFIPANVNLHLHQYKGDGDEIIYLPMKQGEELKPGEKPPYEYKGAGVKKACFVQKGAGQIDYNFTENVELLYRYATQFCETNPCLCPNVAKQMTPELAFAFKAERICIPPDRQKNDPEAVLDILFSKINEDCGRQGKNYPNFPENNELSQFMQTVHKLWRHLEEALNEPIFSSVPADKIAKSLEGQITLETLKLFEIFSLHVTHAEKKLIVSDYAKNCRKILGSDLKHDKKFDFFKYLESPLHRSVRMTIEDAKRFVKKIPKKYVRPHPKTHSRTSSFSATLSL